MAASTICREWPQGPEWTLLAVRAATRLCDKYWPPQRRSVFPPGSLSSVALQMSDCGLQLRVLRRRDQRRFDRVL
jgi:hypothetical protein